jgi:hypothetical protein
MDETFGTADDEQQADRRIHVCWPLVARNGIELHLIAARGSEMQERAPTLFYDEGDVLSEFSFSEYEKIFGRKFTQAEIEQLQNIVWDIVYEKYRRQLIAARDAGANPKMELYLLICAAEKIDPMREKVAL